MPSSFLSCSSPPLQPAAGQRCTPQHCLVRCCTEMQAREVGGHLDEVETALQCIEALDSCKSGLLNCLSRSISWTASLAINLLSFVPQAHLPDTISLEPGDAFHTTL